VKLPREFPGARVAPLTSPPEIVELPDKIDELLIAPQPFNWVFPR